VAVLNEMQMLDQQIAPTLAVAEQRAHLVERGRFDLAALGRAARATTSAAEVLVCFVNDAAPCLSLPRRGRVGEQSEPGWGCLKSPPPGSSLRSEPPSPCGGGIFIVTPPSASYAGTWRRALPGPSRP